VEDRNIITNARVSLSNIEPHLVFLIPRTCMQISNMVWWEMTLIYVCYVRVHICGCNAQKISKSSFYQMWAKNRSSTRSVRLWACVKKSPLFSYTAASSHLCSRCQWRFWLLRWRKPWPVELTKWTVDAKSTSERRYLALVTGVAAYLGRNAKVRHKRGHGPIVACFWSGTFQVERLLQTYILIYALIVRHFTKNSEVEHARHIKIRPLKR